MAEKINDLHRVEVVHRRRNWQRIEQIELENPDRMDWHSIRRIMKPIGDIVPAKSGSTYREQKECSAIAAGLNRESLRKSSHRQFRPLGRNGPKTG